jgi:phospholipid/cholesterol/gamma-HCH transport system substrate-binding protein
MDFRYGREVTVGTLVIISALVFIFGTMWLSGRSITKGNSVTIQFADVSGLKRASPVRISGVAVGRVERITIVEVGKVLVFATLGNKIRPKIDASAQIVPVTLVGDFAVDFNPGQASQPLPSGRVIVGSKQRGIADKAEGLTDRADSLLISAQEMVNKETADQLRATLKAMQSTLAATQRTMQLYGNAQQGPSAELQRTLMSFNRLGARFDSTLANPALQRALGKSDSLTGNLSAMSQRFAATGERLDSLLARVDRGEGTFGKLTRDTALYGNIVHLTASMDSLVNFIQRNPGKIVLHVPVKVF